MMSSASDETCQCTPIISGKHLINRLLQEHAPNLSDLYYGPLRDDATIYSVFNIVKFATENSAFISCMLCWKLHRSPLLYMARELEKACASKTNDSTGKTITSYIQRVARLNSSFETCEPSPFKVQKYKPHIDAGVVQINHHYVRVLCIRGSIQKLKYLDLHQSLPIVYMSTQHITQILIPRPYNFKIYVNLIDDFMLRTCLKSQDSQRHWIKHLYKHISPYLDVEMKYIEKINTVTNAKFHNPEFQRHFETLFHLIPWPEE